MEIIRIIFYDKYRYIRSCFIFLNIYRNLSSLKHINYLMQACKFYCTLRTCDDNLGTSYIFSKGYFVLFDQSFVCRLKWNVLLTNHTIFRTSRSFRPWSTILMYCLETSNIVHTSYLLPENSLIWFEIKRPTLNQVT